jgi:hypothetical protein
MNTSCFTDHPPALPFASKRRDSKEEEKRGSFDPGVFFITHKPLWAALAVWTGLIGSVLAAAIARTEGVLVYGLDDAYIHLAIAKHFLENGVWGVTPYAFSSSSSSPLWPLLLAAGGKIFGALYLWPLFINLAASFFILIKAYSIARRFGWQGGRAAALPLAMLLVLPAVPLVMIGMESLLFAAVALAFADTAVQFLLAPDSPGLWKFSILAFLLCAVRYEGLFLMAVVGLLLLARRRGRAAVCVGTAAILPAALYAVASLHLGWYALPNSLMIKHSPLAGNDPASLWNLVARIFLTIPDTLTVAIPRWNSLLYAAAVLSAVCIAAGKRFSFWSRPVLSLIVLAGTAAIHGMLVAVEWQYRYEAYLIGIGVWAIAAMLAEWPPHSFTRPQATAVVSLALLLGYAPLRGAVEGIANAPQATRNIFEQQMQMGRFLGAYYNGQAVVANDIGAVDYLADLRLVDAYGLASMPVAMAKQTGDWEKVRRGILRGQASSAQADIAVLYDSWFADGADIPAEWVRLERWTIRGNVVCGSETVSWYATDPRAAGLLRGRLDAFRPQLPPSVIVQEEVRR